MKTSNYKPDATPKESFYYRDEHNLIVSRSETGGKGDCIGRTMRAYYCYRDPYLVSGILDLWTKSESGHVIGVRHPDLPDRKMSRDHLTNTLVLLKLYESDLYTDLVSYNKVTSLIKSIPFKILNTHRLTLSLICWAKSLRGNKVALFAYLIIELLLSNLLYRPLRWLGYKIAGWEPEMNQANWNAYPPKKLQEQPKLNQIIDKIVFPAYALGYTAWQLKVSDDTFPRLKKAVQKSYLKMAGRTNYVQRMMLGDTDISEFFVRNYKPMRTNRWSGYLNSRNDRNMYIYNPPYEYNNIDRDLLLKLYKETQLNK